MVKLKLLVLLLFAVFTAALLLTENVANPHARAFSAGPPAGFTHAPGELDCADCHTTPAQSIGSLVLGVPQTYTPGQTYDITVRHNTADPTRVRWGFELTALDGADEKAGSFAPADDLTRVVNGEGPFPSREYIEHTSKGSFPGQQNGAVWTFKWSAPTEDVGPVTFYVAGNQANGDGNSSGDNIYFTFVSSSFKAPAPDFQLTVTPASLTVVRGTTSSYNVTVTPLNGFTGTVALNLTGLPPNAVSGFDPAALQFNDSSPKTAVLSVSAAANTPTGAYSLNVNASAGQLAHTAQPTLKVVQPTDADLALTQTVSPNPVQTNTDIRFTINVTNNGPAKASAPNLIVTLPSAFHTFNEGALGEMCVLNPVASGFAYDCHLSDIPSGQSVTVDFTARTSTQGLLQTTTTVSATERDPFTTDNTINRLLPVEPQSAEPSMNVSTLGVRAVVRGLDQPTSMAFIGASDFFVLEKATGRVVRVKNGVALGAVLDLAVNSASERGLLGVALHPSFAANGFVYLFWTESSTGADTTAIDEVPLLGNRVDRFIWNGSSLTFDRTLIRLRSFQADAGQPSRGNHNGGVLRFGPDGKLYVLMGDNGRRGFMQNLPCGPTLTCPAQTLTPDDQFGGPEPDNAHFTGFILRLNDDGTTPSDNPYAQIPTTQTTPITENIRRIFAYGVRNGFGMDFDPVGGHLWTQENGDDAFDEINRVEAGFNGGWIQLMGPSSRVAEFKAIEVARGNSLQQNRWPPSNIADTPAEALSRLYNLPGSHYTEPEFSWKYAIAPSPVGFAGPGLGVQYSGDLFVGASRTTLLGGYLMRFRLSADRRQLVTTDSRLADKVADNVDKFDLSESESLVVGRDFGITTDIRTDPFGGNLHVVSLSNGAVYEVFPRPQLFVANLEGAQEVPARNTVATGTATLLLDKNETTARVSLSLRRLTGTQTSAHIQGPALIGANGPQVFTLPNGNFSNFEIALTPQQVADLKAGLYYVEVRTDAFPEGEIRGQFHPNTRPSVVRLDVSELEVPESAGFKTIHVERLGDTSEAASVVYQAETRTASSRTDFTAAGGTLRFAPGETRKSFDVLITDDGLAEPTENFGVLIASPSGAASLGRDTSLLISIIDNDQPPPATNPVDESAFFVRQHYHDFLNREPDADGLAFWTGEIEQCGANAQCREVKRINVSAAFFLSIEFQETGYLFYRLNVASFGRQPRLESFLPNTQAIGLGVVVGRPGWEALLAARQQEFADAWVMRQDFRADFDGLSNRDYVNRLFERALVTPSTAERDALVAALDSGAKTRARVLLDVAENAIFKQQERNRAFVLMEYFGYLRRNPDDTPEPNRDLTGYNFWLSKLEEFNGDFVRAEMVKAFISSTEYRSRFGQP